MTAKPARFLAVSVSGALLKTAMVTSGAITNRVDRMESKGLVQRVRDPGDRRGVRVRLTPAGLALIEELMPKHVADERRMLAALSADDRDTLAGPAAQPGQRPGGHLLGISL